LRLLKLVSVGCTVIPMTPSLNISRKIISHKKAQKPQKGLKQFSSNDHFVPYVLFVPFVAKAIG
jgi:hypothetical protein